MANFLNNYFPQGLATAESFIGRQKEMEWLMKNIQIGHHTLLLAPRRYGKTSLAINILQKLDLPYVEINCYLILSADALEKKFLLAAQTLLNNIISKPEQILTSVQSFFKKSKKHWTLGFKGIFGVEIIPEKDNNHADNILTTLQLIEDTLAKQKKNAVMFIDEIQEIDLLKENKQIEGAIRQFAQQSKSLVFIFSGSNRHMLLHMFDDRSMPLYELCDRIILDRISEESYEQYLNKVAKKTFDKFLPQETGQKIFELSERHPKRIYNLCFYLWRLCENANKVPTAQDVVDAWDMYVNQRLKDSQYHLRRLSAGQIKVLTLIATSFDQEITGQLAQKKVKISGPSIVKALQVLEMQDYIERMPDKFGPAYRVIDPLLRDVLVKYELGNLN